MEEAQVVENQADVSADNQEAVTSNNQATNSLLDGEDVSGIDFSKGKPEGFPDDFWDAEKNTVKSDVLYEKYKEEAARAKGLRDKLAKGENKAPKTPEEYGFSVPEDIADRIKPDDPLLGEAAKLAHKYGMSKEAFNGFMGEMVKTIAENSPANQELSPEQVKEIRDAEMRKIGENGVQVARAVASWVQELESVGTLDSEMSAAVKNAASNGHFVRALNAMRAHYGAGRDVPMTNIDDGLPADPIIGDKLVKAYNSGDQSKIAEVNRLLEARIKAGRPDKLQM